MKRYAMLLIATVVLVCSAAASATAFDFLEFAKNELLVCAHPTADPAKAKVEFQKEPVKEAELTRAEVTVFYKGWVRDNEMVVEIKYLETSYVTLVKAELIKDSAATGTMSCKYFTGWQEVK